LHIPDRIVDPVTPPLVNAGVDAIDDIPREEAFIDIDDFGVAMNQEGGTTTLFSSTAELLPANISNLNYLFFADVDNDSTTGGSPADIGMPTTTRGIDLVWENGVRLDILGLMC
jgi:hypothetical protein